MELSRSPAGDALEVKVKGRLDGYWADHLSEAFDQMVRDGSHRLRLDLSDVSYISSAGIAVLVNFYKQLEAIHGWLAVTKASAQVRKVLDMARLTALLVAESPGGVETLGPVRLLNLMEPGRASFEVREIRRGARLDCRVVGDPDLLRGCRFEARHARRIAMPAARFALGLGAFGDAFEDAAGRFGEFLAAGGAAAHQPTDGTNVADYVVSAGDLIPEVLVLYGMVCEGEFSHLARFEPKAESGPVPLTQVAETCLDIAGSEAAGLVMVAESAGLLGASLRRSPARPGAAAAPFGYPEVREWVSFSAEPAHRRSLALVAGVVSRGGGGALGPLLRPLGKDAGLAGHFHAAAFSYRPVKKGSLALQPTVATLFEAETLQGVLHLIGDDRGTAGCGESEFVRGACWVAPLSEIRTEGF